MDEYEEHMKSKIEKMDIKGLNNFPLFKANKNKILDEALAMAASGKKDQKYVTGGRYSKGSGYRLEPVAVEFRVHYITSVS